MLFFSKQADKLFEKFVTKSEKGIGLGLYISRKIIEAHGGRIWAKELLFTLILH
jgi:signal transduction histidine kinase